MSKNSKQLTKMEWQKRCLKVLVGNAKRKYELGIGPPQRTAMQTEDHNFIACEKKFARSHTD